MVLFRIISILNFLLYIAIVSSNLKNVARFAYEDLLQRSMFIVYGTRRYFLQLVSRF